MLYNTYGIARASNGIFYVARRGFATLERQADNTLVIDELTTSHSAV